MLGMFLAALDQTIVASAIRTIGDDLHGLSIQAWVTTAYLITATISTPLYGKLSDIYGRKPFFLTAITIFLIGSAACAFSTSMYMLAGVPRVAGPRRRRPVLAGPGDHRRHRAAPRAGPLPGLLPRRLRYLERARPGDRRLLRRHRHHPRITGWRWVFLVNVPIGIVALVVVAKVLNIPHSRREHRIDWRGASPSAIAWCRC